MVTRTKPIKPGPGEELIGTITPHGIRLTRATWRAQLDYRDRARAQAEAREKLRASHRSVELRIAWSSNAPFRVHVAVARWSVPQPPPSDGVATSEADKRRRSPRHDSNPPPDTANRGRRSTRLAVGPGEAPAIPPEVGRWPGNRTRPF